MTSRKRAYAQVGAVLAGCALLAACTPAAAPPAPTPSPSPEAPTPTETDQQRQERLAYEGAEKAYRTFRGEYDRIIAASNHPRSTPLLRSVASGPYLDSFEDFLRVRRKRELGARGNFVIGFIRHDGFSPREVLLTVCEDGSAVQVLDNHGKVVGRGDIGTIQLTVKLVKSRWTVYDGNKEKVVKSCAA